MHGSQGTTHGVQTAESIVKEWEEEERENAARLALSDLQTIFRDRSPALTIRAVEKEIQRRMQTRKVAFKDFRRRFNANAGVLEEERCEKLRRIFRVLAQLRRLLDLLQMREEEGDVHEEAHMNSSGTHRNNNNNNGLVAISKSKEWLSVARENQREIEEERTTANRSLEHITADRGAVGGAVFRAGKAHHPRSRGAQLTAMATDQQEQQRNKKKKEMATTIVMKRKTHEKDDDDGDVVPHRASLHNPQASSAKAPRLNFKEMMPNDDASKAPQGLCSYCCESYPFNDLARVEIDGDYGSVCTNPQCQRIAVTRGHLKQRPSRQPTTAGAQTPHLPSTNPEAIHDGIKNGWRPRVVAGDRFFGSPPIRMLADSVARFMKSGCRDENIEKERQGTQSRRAAASVPVSEPKKKEYNNNYKISDDGVAQPMNARPSIRRRRAKSSRKPYMTEGTDDNPITISSSSEEVEEEEEEDLKILLRHRDLPSNPSPLDSLKDKALVLRPRVRCSEEEEEEEEDVGKPVMKRDRSSNLVQRLAGLRCVMPPWGGPGSVEFTAADYARLGPDEFLNDTAIDYYLRMCMLSLEKSNPEAAKRCYIFNSFLYKKLTERSGSVDDLSEAAQRWAKALKLNAAERRALRNYEKVANWTRDVDIFSKDYVFVPIHDHLHWSVVVVCHPSHHVGRRQRSSASQGKESRENSHARYAADAHELANEQAGDGSIDSSPLESPPDPRERPEPEAFLLHLDSLDDGHTRDSVAQVLRRYLANEWRTKAAMDKDSVPRRWALDRQAASFPEDDPSPDDGTDRSHHRSFKRMKSIKADVPRQENHCDCGLFVCAFVEYFLATLPPSLNHAAIQATSSRPSSRYRRDDRDLWESRDHPGRASTSAAQSAGLPYPGFLTRHWFRSENASLLRWTFSRLVLLHMCARERWADEGDVRPFIRPELLDPKGMSHSRYEQVSETLKAIHEELDALEARMSEGTYLSPEEWRPHAEQERQQRRRKILAAGNGKLDHGEKGSAKGGKGNDDYEMRGKGERGQSAVGTNAASKTADDPSVPSPSRYRGSDGNGKSDVVEDMIESVATSDDEDDFVTHRGRISRRIFHRKRHAALKLGEEVDARRRIPKDRVLKGPQVHADDSDWSVPSRKISENKKEGGRVDAKVFVEPDVDFQVDLDEGPATKNVSSTTSWSETSSEEFASCASGDGDPSLLQQSKGQEME